MTICRKPSASYALQARHHALANTLLLACSVSCEIKQYRDQAQKLRDMQEYSSKWTQIQVTVQINVSNPVQRLCHGWVTAKFVSQFLSLSFLSDVCGT